MPHRYTTWPAAGWVRRDLGLAALVLIAGCARERSDTAIIVQVSLAPDTPPPTFLDFSWLDEERGLVKDRRIPVKVRPTKGAATPLFKVFMEIDPDDSAGGRDRRAIVTGSGGGTALRAWDSIQVVPGRWKVLPLVVRAVTFADADSDAVPDDIDRCPNNDFVGCATPADAGADTLLGDAAADVTGATDARADGPGSPDAGDAGLKADVSDGPSRDTSD